MPDNLSIPQLKEWPKPLKHLIICFLFLLTSGVTFGLFYLNETTSLTASGAIDQYQGSPENEDSFIDMKEKYPKSIAELLLTTHNHLIGFSFIFIILGIIFYFNSIVQGRLKVFLMVEPFISSWTTFLSLWAIRYVDESFIYLTVLSAILTYLSFYVLIIVLIYNLVQRQHYK